MNIILGFGRAAQNLNSFRNANQGEADGFDTFIAITLVVVLFALFVYRKWSKKRSEKS